MTPRALPVFRDSNTAFVILTWNSEAYVEDCLRSVLGLSCARLDVWVVDNGSTDETPGILAAVAAGDARLHPLYEEANLGTTVSRNKVLRSLPADMDYVCVLDSDTVVNQDAFEKLTNALRSDPGIGVVGPTMASSSGEIQLSGRNLPTLGIKLGKAFPFGNVAERAAEAEVPGTPIVDGFQDVGYLLSACWFMPRTSLDRVGLLDEEIFYAPEDVDWCLRCHKVGLRVVRVHGARIVHEYQRISRKRLFSKANFEHVKGLLRYFRKHGYLMRGPKTRTEGNRCERGAYGD